MLRVLSAESVFSETRTPAGDANSLVARALSSPLSRSTPRVLLVKDSLDGQAAWVRVFNSAKELQATQASGATQ
jgi:hypothetical protein